MTISIWGRYRSNAPEVIDRASSEKEANYLLQEYMLAFGAFPGQPHHKDWNLWAGRKADEPAKDQRAA